jgi:hypothetical protein
MRSFYGFCLGAFVGGALLFLGGVGAAFRTLPAPFLLPFLDHLFPSFYALTTVSALLATLLALAAKRVRLPLLLLPAFAFVLQLLGWFVLLPLVHRAVGQEAFFRLHGIALGVAMLAFLAVALALVVAVVAELRRP